MRCTGRAAPWCAQVTLALVASGLGPGRALAQNRDQLAWLVDSLRVYVEGATRLKFQRPPRYGLHTPAQISEYLRRRFEGHVPAGRLDAIAAAYHLFGLLPDTIAFRSAIIDFNAASIMGFYDPETDTLYCRTGLAPAQLREVLTHEMVHALQAQYVNLDSLIAPSRESDRAFASKAVIEGQAMFATVRLLAGGRNVVAYTGIWNAVVETVRLRTVATPRTRRIPLLLREGLIAPYLFGAQFMSAWQGYRWSDTIPFGRLMPQSSEQILHPERYAAGDAPIELRFVDSVGRVRIEDVLGEFDLHLLEAQLAGATTLGKIGVLGWGGDRYRVYETPGGLALVWYVIWDNPAAAAAFHAGAGAKLEARRRPGWRGSLERLEIAGRPASRYVWAPERWDGWARVPEVEMVAGAR
jgi:hypothetical protein